MNLSIVIPAYNESKRIGHLLQDILNNFSTAEVIVVEDGSTDGTAQVISSIMPHAKVLSNGLNRGKGYSVKRGMLEANGDYVCFMDADGAVPVSELNRLLKQFNKADIVIASRRVQGANVNMPFYRKMLEVPFNWLIRRITGLSYKDTQCGFKLFTQVAAKDIFARLPDIPSTWCFDIEVLLIAIKLGYSVTEVPVNWRYISGSKVRLAKDGPKILLFIVILLMRKRKVVLASTT